MLFVQIIRIIKQYYIGDVWVMLTLKWTGRVWKENKCRKKTLTSTHTPEQQFIRGNVIFVSKLIEKKRQKT